MVLNCDIWVADYKLLVTVGRIRTERQATDVVCEYSLTFDTRLSIIQRYRKLESNARKITYSLFVIRSLNWTGNFGICFLYIAFLIIQAESSLATVHAFTRLFLASYCSK
jgi:hypothetical protein